MMGIGTNEKGQTRTGGKQMVYIPLIDLSIRGPIMKPLRITIVCTLAPLLLTGCEGLRELGVNIEAPYEKHNRADHHRAGPPPHAPAHGYRHRNSDGVALRFDSNLGVYVVVDMPNVYYYNGLYLRLSGDRWQATSSLKRTWHYERDDRVPYQLQKKRGHGHYKDSKGKGHGKKRHWKDDD